ncbi:hypothetical protein V2O64_25080 (plasmid) [Verrucomicrobiaceae bacterium 227]
MSITLQLPPSLDEKRSLQFCSELNKCGGSVEIDLDVSTVRWAFPFGSLIIASQVRRLRKHEEVNFNLLGYDEAKQSHSYLSHIGFFQLLGFDIGKPPGEANGGDSYLPLTVLNYDSLYIDEIFGGESIHKAIQKKSEEFAKLLTQSNKLTIVRPVSYCIRELVRNVFEHSTCNECILGGQRYRDGRVLVGIVDYGRGLKKSLEERYSVPNDIEALKMAIRPGISRSVPDPDDDNPWANSGFGLYTLANLGRRTGYFSITSGQSILELSANGAACDSALHNGTAINIIFKKLHGTNLENLIQQIIAEGEQRLKSEGKKARASKSTKTF